MKKRNNISYFSYAFMALAFMGAVTACNSEEDFGVDNTKPTINKEGLAVLPTVAESDVKLAVTRAESATALKEKDLNTLDVFVEHVTNGTGDGTFLKQYHLTSNIIENDLNKLAERWRHEGLQDGEEYNIYVAANNPLTKVDVADVTALKALTFNEVTEGIATLEDGNIGWKDDDTSGKIYKVYSGDITGRAYTSEKDFMMDGVTKNWTPNPASLDQTFDVTMNRAAAKIVLNVKFDENFVKSLAYNKDDQGEYTVEKPAAEKVTITGTPAWKFYNFAFGAPVFTPDTEPTAGVEVHNSGFNIFHNQSVDGGAPFTITTYSYPNKWTDTTDAPSMVVSIGYTQNGTTSYNYYRIPIVGKDTKKFDRNTIYVIDATIKTRGSETHEDITEMENLVYEVLPWNDETNSAAIHNDVESVQHYYFKVNPKIYTLRGDGDQSVPLTYLKASGTKVNWKLFTYDEDGNQTGVVANDDEDAIRAWFYNANGTFTTTYNDNESGMNWSNTGPTPMGVTITQSTEGTSGTSGTVTVTSHALNNRAIKYIRLRVYLDESATFQDGKETMYEDIIIRHFPTDNIQNIVGSWSSYVPASGGTQEVTLTTRDKAEADAWAEQYGVSYTTTTGTATDYISYAEYSQHTGDAGYTMTGPTASTRNAFLTAITSNENRQAADSQVNAVADSGEGHNYYWGTGVTTVATNVRQRNMGNYTYDYYTDGTQYNRYNLYRYSNYYTVTYTHSYSYTEYSMTVEIPTTGNWVDWERDAGVTYNQADVKYTRSEIFTAKVFSNNRMYAIEPTRTNTGSYYNPSYQYTYNRATNQDSYYTYQEGGGYSQSNSQLSHLTNVHMYVIQISSTSEGYIMGRPILGNPDANRSQDDVVSPAFMIASQLGAVTPTNSNTTAAQHCRRYMEVAADGTRYTGWRLPTPDEISVITRYQQGTINGVTISDANYQAMTPVLTGNTYWSLTGNPVSTGMGSGGPYLRCVRDLSAAEVEALNGFDAIIEKYQN